MATTDAQTLTAYTQTALEILRETTDPSALSNLTKELFIQAREYPTLREILKRDDVHQAVGKALVNKNAEGLKAILISILTEVNQEVRPEQVREIPGPDPFATEESYASVIKLKPKDLLEVEDTSLVYLAEKKAKGRQEFAKKLTDNFISRSRIQITEEQKLREEKRIEQALSLETNIKTVIEQSPLRETISDRDFQRIARDSEQAAQRVSAAQERIERAMAAAASSIAADEVVVHKPDIFLKIAADQAERSNAPMVQIIDRAAALERATEGFVGGAEELPQNLSLLATNPLQKMTAWAVDRLPDGPRSAIIAGVVGGAWEKAIDTATRYYGQQVVNEPWFQQAIARGNQGLSGTKGAFQSLTSGAQNFLGDVANTVFRGSMDEATIAYIETVRLNVTVVPTVNYQQFYTAAVYSHNPGILSYGLNLGLQYGTRKATRALINAGVKKAAEVGAEAVAGAASGGTLTLAMIAADFLRGMVNKGVSVFKSLIGMGTSKSPEDNLLLVVAAGVVLVFFLPLFPLFNLPAFNQSMIDTSLATNMGGGEGTGNEPSVPPPSFGPINGSVTDCIVSQSITIDGVTTLVLSADRAGRIQNISHQYPQLGCYSQVLQCPTQKINISAFPADSGGYGGYAPSRSPGNIIFYPKFFTYNDYYFARTFAHEMMHEVEWLHSDIYDAFMHGAADGSFSKGYCGPLGTYTAGFESDYETMAEAAALYMVGNPLLQQKCLPAYNFMRTLFSQCQK
jgi:hypothetical protein